MNVFGPRIRLRPTRHEDLPFLAALWNTGTVMHHLGFPDGMHVTATCMERWWAMTPQAQSPATSASTLATPHCIIELLDGTPIGEFLYSYDAHRRARFDLKLTAAQWGQGYAYETMTLALREIFATTNITHIIVEPSPENHAAQRLLRHCGFHATPTENHPRRWSCARLDFADRAKQPLAEVA